MPSQSIGVLSVDGDLRLKLKANVMNPHYSSTDSLVRVTLKLPIQDYGLPNGKSRSYSLPHLSFHNFSLTTFSTPNIPNLYIFLDIH